MGSVLNYSKYVEQVYSILRKVGVSPENSRNISQSEFVKDLHYDSVEPIDAVTKYFKQSCSFLEKLKTLNHLKNRQPCGCKTR